MSTVVEALRRRQSLRVLAAEGSIKGLLLARAAEALGTTGLFYVAPDDATARTVAADAAFFMGVSTRDGFDGEGPILVVPEIDASPWADVASDPRTVAARLAALSRLQGGSGTPPVLVIASLRSASRRVLPRADFEQLSTLWGKGGALGREEAVEVLVRAGYGRVDVVEDLGTFAVRGGVMDVWIPIHRHPIRIEFFGDEIERMRIFDPDTQRSLREIGECVVHPARETVTTTRDSLRRRVLALGDANSVPTAQTRQVIENLEAGVDFFGIEALVPLFHEPMVPLWDHLPADMRWFVDDLDGLVAAAGELDAGARAEHARAVEQHRLVAAPEAFFVDPDQLERRLRAEPVAAERLEIHDPERPDTVPTLRIEVDADRRLQAALATAREHKGGEILRPLVEHIRGLAQGLPWRVVLVAPNLAHAERLTALLRGYELEVAPPRTSEQARFDPEVAGRRTLVEVVAGGLSEGFASTADRLLLLSEADLFGRLTRRPAASRRRAGVGSLTQLAVGDHVVHVLHGVGRYAGLVKLVLAEVPGDFVLIEYAGKDRLYLPVYRLGEVERFVAAEGKPPRLDRLGGTTFATKANKVKDEVRQMAEELLQIYAQREAEEREPHLGPEPVYREFEATFPFEETPDQLEAIDSVLADLDSRRPMDRLVCGDVGFGKTEVALRAAFRVVTAGRQVAVLAPTTILVQQHTLTFRDRMADFGARVEGLNRFLGAQDRARVLAELRTGQVDLVVGTHRLLGSDVHFKDLGLVVIDEEQRFGVAQKERFKRLRTQVDVLTLSATPIPRTLHMSLLGIRDVSLVMTPPVDRLAVRTFLTRAGDAVIEEAIRRELSRGGQTFYVVPKIEGIEEHAVRIRELIPEARVLVAHGQMPGEMLERTMFDFVEHRADVLVSTSIIESGLDIPRANTMLVARADLFGMSQLYQLRGRIGRSKHRAYCYLMVNALEKLSPDARKRLQAIQRHSQLGSGFNVASEDLEIRGAGDILGGRQSGNIQAVGFEAYTRLIQDAVAELQGKPIRRDTDPELLFDLPAYLPEAYVEDVGQRLDLYRRLSAAEAADEVDAVMDEIRDRFGDPPIEALHLGHVMACKTYGRRLRALALELKARKFSVRLGPDTPLPVDVAARLSDTTSGRFRLTGPDRVTTTVPESPGRDRSPTLTACTEALSELLTYAKLA